MAFTVALSTCLILCLTYATEKGPHEQWLDPAEHWLHNSDSYSLSQKEKVLVDAQSGDCKSGTTGCQSLSTKDEKEEVQTQRVGVDGKCEADSELVMSHFRRYVSVLVNMVTEKGIAAGTDFLIHCKLDEARFGLLKNFSRGQDFGVSEVNSVLEKMITDMSRTDGAHIPPTSSFGLDITAQFGTVTTLAMFFVAILLAIWLIIQMSRIPLLPVWKYFVGFVFFVLISSTVVEWFHLYQTAVAEKMSTQAKDLPSECTPEGMTGWTTLASWVKSTFTLSEDACLKYYQSISVDPIVRANPTKALVISITHVIVEPLKLIFAGLGAAFRALLQPLPAQWQPFVFIIGVILLVLFLVMAMGYSVSLPFLFSFGPRERRPALAASTEMSGILHQIQEGISEQKVQTERLQEQNRALQEQLKNLQAARPQLAIKSTVHPINSGADLPTPIQESHLNIAAENDLDGKVNNVDSIGASVSGQ